MGAWENEGRSEDRMAANEQIAARRDGLVSQDGHPAEGLILTLWMEEAQRRLEELRTGQVKGIDSVEAFRKAREAVEHSRGLR